jgi:hypothetical protein
MTSIRYIAAAGFTLIGLITVATADAAGPDPGLNVVVNNPTSQPVPVTLQGTGSITGSVTVTNTPSVTVTNTPNVTVANPASSPVPVTGTVTVVPPTPRTFFASLEAFIPGPGLASFVVPNNAFLKVIDMTLVQQTAAGCSVGVGRAGSFLVSRIFLDDNPNAIASGNAANINLGPGIEFSAGQTLVMLVGVSALPGGNCDAQVIAVFETRP